jgi:hypothetical protein
MVLIGIVIARVGAGDLDMFVAFAVYFGTLTPCTSWCFYFSVLKNMLVF